MSKHHNIQNLTTADVLFPSEDESADNFEVREKSKKRSSTTEPAVAGPSKIKKPKVRPVPTIAKPTARDLFGSDSDDDDDIEPKAKVPNLTLGEDFGYDGSIGPSYWGERYRECTGKHQSPININLLRVKQVTLPDIVFTGFDDSIDDVHVSNNGHTVLIEVQNEPHPRVRGGPLEGDYVFSQMHFHWGDNDTFGSEDKINHKSFPMELHMVFFKEEYQSVAEAVKHEDGLTVLAFFYELDRHQHPAYDDIVSALGNVTDPHTSVIMSHPFSFLNILPYDLKRYFTYRGSLTTPPCSEVVIWLDFEQPVRLTHEQIEAFRELKSVNGKITHNFRPIQPLGDRVVFYNIDNSYFSYNEIDDPEETTVKPSRRKNGKGSGHITQANLVNLLFLVCCLLLTK